MWRQLSCSIRWWSSWDVAESSDLGNILSHNSCFPTRGTLFLLEPKRLLDLLNSWSTKNQFQNYFINWWILDVHLVSLSPTWGVCVCLCLISSGFGLLFGHNETFKKINQFIKSIHYSIILIVCCSCRTLGLGLLDVLQTLKEPFRHPQFLLICSFCC